MMMTDCVGECGRQLAVDDDEEDVLCRDCGMADLEAAHGAEWLTEWSA